MTVNASADIKAFVAQGRQFQRAQDFAAALAAFDSALALDPASLEALGNRGMVLGMMGRFADACADFDRAIALAPGHPALLFNRGNALRYLGRLQDALKSYDATLAEDPEIADAWINRGNTLRDLKRPLEALASYDRAILLRPDDAKALYNRGNLIWVDMRQVETALADFERAFAIDPDGENLRGDLLHLRMHVGQWQDFEAQKDLVDAGVRAGRRVVGPFAYQAISQSPADLAACSRIYAQTRYPEGQPLRTAPYEHAKIRIGYLCGEFREQATSMLMAGLYELHDRSRFEIIAFDNGWDDNSLVRRRMEIAFDKFIDISGLSDADAAARILAEEIDILVNLNGYFGAHRMGVFALRPAPIQVNYLGFPATLGAPYLDYILADATLIPDSEQEFYAEKTVTLPDCYQANDARRALPGPIPNRAACGLPDTGFVFCNFNQSYKLTPSVFAAWMRIMAQTPGSVLWLLENNSQFQDNIRREAAAAGIDGARIIFAPIVPPDQHLTRLQLADLFLDTAPYNAHTTGADALWAGVPMLTCRGQTFPGRVAQSLLEAVGLPGLVTDDMAAYEAMAVQLAANPVVLQGLRQNLMLARRTAPLFNTDRFRRHVEAAYIRMMYDLRRGTPPQSFAVSPQD